MNDNPKVEAVGDLETVLSEFASLKEAVENMPTLFNEALDSRDYISKADVKPMISDGIADALIPYSKTIAITEIIRNEFAGIKQSFDDFMTTHVTKSADQTAMINHHAGRLKILDIGHDKQQDQLSALDAILVDIPIIKESLLGDGQQTGLVGRMENNERLMRDLNKSIATTNLSIIKMNEEHAKAKEVATTLRNWHTDYDNRQSELKKLQLAKVERRRDTIAMLVDKALYVALRAGLGGGVATAIAGLFEIAGR